MKKSKPTVVGLATRLCTAARKRRPALLFFLDDPPCSACMKKAKLKLQEAKTR